MTRPESKGVNRLPEAVSKRLDYLEDMHRHTLEALELATRLGDFETSLNRYDTPAPIIRQTLDNAMQTLPFEYAGIYLFDEESADMDLSRCEPESAAASLEAEMEKLVEDRSVGFALNRRNASFSRPLDGGGQMLLHPIATPSRVRGVFLGRTRAERKDLADTSLAVLTIILQNSAGALESWALYRLLRQANEDLQDQVDSLARSEKALEKERATLKRLVNKLRTEVAERRKVAEDLRDSRQRLALVMDSIPHTIFWKDREHRYLGCNANFARAARMDEPADVVGLTDHELPWDDQETEYFHRIDDEVMRNDRSRTDVIQSRRFVDGSMAWVEARKVPLHNARGEVVGVLGVCEDITERKVQQEQLTHQALHDALTGFPNRVLFMERLERALERAKRREGYRFAVLMLDLDRFKQVNDTLGHLAGDKMLVETVRRVDSCVRSMDTVARLGGDEFAVLLEEFANNREVVRIGRRIQETFAEPYRIMDRDIYTTSSIGLVVRTGDYRTAEAILRDADIAMYSSKSHGGNRIRVFNRGMHDQAVRIATLENDLRRCRFDDELFLRFQPIQSLNGKGLAGMEALIRWNHPTRGEIPPMEFIPLAEETGLIQPLGEWVLRSACATLAAWRDAMPEAEDITIAVNISGRQLEQPGLVDAVATALRTNDLPPACLHLELTETAIMENANVAYTILRRLKDLGVGLAIDDFGTGYSSLSYLKRFPVDTLKVDRSFVHNLPQEKENREIVRTVVVLAHTLGMDVVAEGVETPLQMEALRDLDCECMQGFLLARPMREERARNYVREAMDGHQFHLPMD